MADILQGGGIKHLQKGDNLPILFEKQAKINKALTESVKASTMAVTNATANVPSQVLNTTVVQLFTAPEDGLYIIDAFAWYTSNSNGFRRFRLSPKMDYTQVDAGRTHLTPYSDNIVCYLEKGEQVTLQLMQNSGSALTVTYSCRYRYIPL